MTTGLKFKRQIIVLHPLLNNHILLEHIQNAKGCLKASNCIPINKCHCYLRQMKEMFSLPFIFLLVILSVGQSIWTASVKKFWVDVNFHESFTKCYQSPNEEWVQFGVTSLKNCCHPSEEFYLTMVPWWDHEYTHSYLTWKTHCNIILKLHT